MKKQVRQSLLASLVLAAGIHQAMADTPTQINITGNVVASPCTVDTANSNLNVNLGNIQATDLATAGATSALKPFQLKLKNCPASTTTAIVTFGGQADAAAPGYYVNSGTANNVAVFLQQSSDGITKGPGTQIGRPVQPDGTVTYGLQVRAYAKGVATPGTISAVVQATFTYQ